MEYLLSLWHFDFDTLMTPRPHLNFQTNVIVEGDPHPAVVGVGARHVLLPLEGPVAVLDGLAHLLVGHGQRHDVGDGGPRHVVLGVHQGEDVAERGSRQDDLAVGRPEPDHHVQEGVLKLDGTLDDILSEGKRIRNFVIRTALPMSDTPMSLEWW